ncbi:MAG TPA: hypothetical protein VGR05_04265 [Sphingomicrobium sp.]|nr:hypothetical protein [Sphingomicrobium sp.]
MAGPTETEEKARRRRRIALGEAIGLTALVISALGLWNSWRNGEDKPAAVVIDRAPKPVPLVLRGVIADDGKVIRLAPLEDSHALDTLTLTAAAPGKGTASFGSEPMLSAELVETWLPADSKREGTGGLTVNAVIKYVEAGENRTATERYRVAYQWKDGGLFGGKTVRLTGFSRG